MVPPERVSPAGELAREASPATDESE